MHTARLTLCAGLLAAAPCLGQQPPPAPPAGATTPVVTVIEPGAAPRQALRLRPAVGAAASIEITARVSQTTTGIPAQAVPPATFRMKSVVTKIGADGEIEYDFTCTDARVAADPAVHPLTLEQMRDAMRMIVGLAGSGTMSDRGVMRRASVAVPAPADPVLQQQARGLEQTLRQINTPLPDAPVGVGAVWEVLSTTNVQGLAVSQRTVCRLEASDGNTLTLAIELTQDAPPQALAAAPGITVTMFVTKGKGTAEIRLDRLFPTATELTISNEAKLRVDADGQEIEQQTQMATSVREVDVATEAPGD